SPAHEARWLNLAGFLLRPGFGDAGDELRVSRLWRVLGAELRHPRAVQCRAEWWNLWKRIAGGLAARQQEHLLQQVSPALLRRGKPRAPRPGAYACALAQRAGARGDREREGGGAVGERVARRLGTAPNGQRVARLVREAVPLEAREEARLLDGAVPAGLRIRST